MKIKKYAEAFQDYFLKQRRIMGVQKALEQSDFSDDENASIERDVD